MSGIARQITEEVLGKNTIEVGKRYVHPQQGIITITGGQYWGMNGLSNHWHWTREDGTEGYGYGGQNDDGTWSTWPEYVEPVGPQDSFTETTVRYVIRGRDFEGDLQTWNFAEGEEAQAREYLQDLKDALDGSEFAYTGLTLFRQTVRSTITEEQA